MFPKNSFEMILLLHIKILSTISMLIIAICFMIVRFDAIVHSHWTFKHILQMQINNASSREIDKMNYANSAATEQTQKIKREFHAGETSILPARISLLLRSARKLKIFIPPLIQKEMNKTHFSSTYPGEKVVLDKNQTSFLAPIADWLWIHNSHQASDYIMRRILHDQSGMFTTNFSEADLCLMDCKRGKIFASGRSTGLGYPFFKVVPGLKWKFSGCKKLYMKFEGRHLNCSSPVPYFHSIYSPSTDAAKPWTINPRRTTLVCFVGSWKRGPCSLELRVQNTNRCTDHARHALINQMQALSDAEKNLSEIAGEQGTLFEAHAAQWFARDSPAQKRAFHERAWSLYAVSDFSLQPAGDTPTRRAFYDSWLMGCIPVVARATAEHTYRNIFKGLIYSLGGLAMEDVVVVVPDDVWRDGSRLLAMLRAIPREEVALRRRRLGSLAPVVQWGWQADGDALTMFLGSMLAPSVRAR